MLIRGVWIVKKVVGVGWCDAPECKVTPAVYSGGRFLSMYTEIQCLTSESNNKTLLH